MLNNFTIKSRLIFVIGLLSFASLLVGGLGLRNLVATNQSLRTVYNDRLVAMGELGQILSMVQENQNLIAMAASGPAANIPAAVSQYEERLGKINQLWNMYIATSLTEVERGLAQKFDASRKMFVANATRPVLAALKAHDLDRAASIVQGPLAKLFIPVRDNMRNLVKLQVDVAKAEYDSAIARYETARNFSIGLLTLSLLSGIAIGAWLIRGISAALAQALQVANSVAAGDLTERIDIQSTDEIGQVLTALQRMNSGLMTIVAEVRSGTDLIATTSSEIAAASQDLSGRTEKQASSLEETAASMEELTATVKQNAENAGKANMLANTASAAAYKGGEVIGQVVDSMDEINSSSRKIVDIISVIDGIAFQTNILALNAAVEAARAGEQGRGFAVVASEVRNLAQRSAAAAKEIKILIGSSVERISAGSMLVNDAGKTMLEIVDSVRSVTDIMGEITVASREQTIGIGQINQAITQMDAVTQQNAALVEEASAAAESMQEQAAMLADVVRVFKLSPGAVALGHMSAQTSSFALANVR